MATPICPVHKVEMKPSRTAGQFYCTQKTGPGPRDYCKEKASEVPSPSGGFPAGSVPTPQATMNGDALGPYALAAACVTFAGVVAASSDDFILTEAAARVEAARLMFSTMKALVGKGADGQGFAHTVGLSEPIDTANANLIASAPALLAALRDVLPFVEVVISKDGGERNEIRARNRSIADVVRAAIAKAEGK